MWFKSKPKKKVLNPASFERRPRANSPESFFPTIFNTKVKSGLRSISIDQPDSANELRESAQQVFKVHAASTTGRALAANVLVKKMYSWRGYEGESSPNSNIHLDKRKANEITLVAANESTIYGTMTMRYDSPAGLACDELYQLEVDALRVQGCQLCEWTKLAIDSASDSKQVFASLIHTSYIYARILRNFTDGLMEVNPRHVSFYKKMLGAKQLSEKKICPRVNAPAVLLHLNFEHMEQQIAQWGGMGDQANQKSFYPYFFSAEEEADIIRRLLNFDET